MENKVLQNPPQYYIEMKIYVLETFKQKIGLQLKEQGLSVNLLVLLKMTLILIHTFWPNTYLLKDFLTHVFMFANMQKNVK